MPKCVKEHDGRGMVRYCRAAGLLLRNQNKQAHIETCVFAVAAGFDCVLTL